MKNTGIIRRIDDLGRLLIPKEFRRALTLHDGDPLELGLEDGCIICKPYRAEHLEKYKFLLNVAQAACGCNFAILDDSGYMVVVSSYADKVNKDPRIDLDRLNRQTIKWQEGYDCENGITIFAKAKVPTEGIRTDGYPISEKYTVVAFPLTGESQMPYGSQLTVESTLEEIAKSIHDDMR